jgi:hypothetical protein
VPVAALGVDFTFEIPPVPASLEIAGQTIALTVSGEISGSPKKPGDGDQSFNLNLRGDFGDFQTHLTPLLQAELNKSDRCGERVSITNATLAPAPPAGDLSVQLHFEKWICLKALGRDDAKKLIGGDATIHVILTPQLESGTVAGQANVQTVHLDADIGTIDADGPLGELLRSGAVATALRDKIREAMLKTIQKSVELDGVIPSQTKRFLKVQSVGFADAGFGRLALDLAGQLQVPGDQVLAVLAQFSNR